ncbi:NAD(P)/FAD-dependent oxidoreductase [Streptomyces sp. NPDC020681]|uniref:NAD(P)/FAD-dependent oxidoreductase n=1 Tax=Streptomyces sp. NPDC020681 TaxID=3365083 RepID=UPI003790898B
MTTPNAPDEALRPDPRPPLSLHAMLGALAGLVSGVPVGALMTYQDPLAMAAVVDLPSWIPYAIYTAAVGALIGVVVGYRRGAVAMAASGGVLIGLLGWMVWSLTVTPLVEGNVPTWSAEAAERAYAEFVGELLHGGLTGLVLHGLLALRARRRRSSVPAPVPCRKPQVVIVGGGFAGVETARRFEHLSLRGQQAEVTLISASNYLLFTPMLAEVASGALEPAHISAPIRSAAPRTRFRHGTVEAIDTNAQVVRIATGPAMSRQIPYDHLVLATGSVPHAFGLPGVEENAWTLKSLDDAIQLRDHVIGLLESADQDYTDDQAGGRAGLLTFVVAGGGFAGTETVAELFDLVHGVAHLYPNIPPGHFRFILVDSNPRILGELSPELGDYALTRLRARGIEFRLGARVAAAKQYGVKLTNGEFIATRTFVWTAGNRPGPLVAGLGGEHARNGALITDAAFRVQGLHNVWAVGDCARIPDPDRPGSAFPPTAQHALREGKAVADNIASVLAGRAPAPFRFRTLGLLVVLGHRTAAAEIRGLRFSGVAAWLMWRAIYLSKLPGFEKRVRVLFDWLTDLVFPRDIVVTTPPPVLKSPVGENTKEESSWKA